MIEKYELAIIGAGPGGLNAAITADQLGLKTILIDSYTQAGGQYFMQNPPDFSIQRLTPTEIEGQRFINRLEKTKVNVIFNTLVWGIFKEGKELNWLIALYGPKKPYYIRADHVILANGAYDTPVAFPGWTLPGVITCGAALNLIKAQRIAPGTKALVTGTGPLLLSAGAHLIEAGVKVLSICESNHILRKSLSHIGTMLDQQHRLLEGAYYFWSIFKGKSPYRTGWSIKEALGKQHVEGAVITRIDSEGKPEIGSERKLDVDLVVTGYSLTPNSGLARLIGCQMEFQAMHGGWIPQRNENLETTQKGIYAIGDGAGIAGAENAMLEGQIAAVDVALVTSHIGESEAQNMRNSLQKKLHKQHKFMQLYGDLFTPQEGLISLAKDDTILCRCEEITLADVKEAVAMGARSVGEVKMITRSGMGNCQGRMCERSIQAAILAQLTGKEITHQEIGYFSIRPPLHPIPESFLANAQLDEE